MGLALYFASQGAGRMNWPLAAAALRVVVAAGGGLIAVHLTTGVSGLFLALGLSLAVFGLMNAATIAAGAWFPRRRRRALCGVTALRPSCAGRHNPPTSARGGCMSAVADIQAPRDPAPPTDGVPRNYNFAADILQRNLDAGRGAKPAFIDPRGSGAMGSSPSGSTASAPCCARSASGAKSAS